MIALAAAVWKLDVPRTVRQAEQNGLRLQFQGQFDRESVIDTYQKYILATRTRTREFWEACRRHLPRAVSAEASNLFHLLGIRRPFPSNWVENAGRFVGACTRDQFNETFDHTPGAPSVRWQGSRRKSWNEMLVIPMYDLPNRICAFVLCGNSLDPEAGDIKVWRPAPVGDSRRQGHDPKEAGLAMLPALFTNHNPRVGGQIFVMDDPVMALRLQLRHLRDSSVPLPLTGAILGPGEFETRSVWGWLPVEKVICWSVKPTRRLLQTARRARSSVSMTSPPPSHVANNLRLKESIEWLVTAASQAKPWDAAAREMMKTQSTSEIQETLLDLELNNSELRKFISDSGEKLQTRLKAVTAQWRVARQARVGSNIIVEREDAWHILDSMYRTENLICNAVLRVEQVMTTSRGDNYFRGVVRFQGTEYPFTELGKIIERSPATWLKEFLLAQNAGMLRYESRWDKHLLQVAYAFTEPQVVSGVDKIGWDDKRRQFNFHAFAIKYDGDVTEECACLLSNATAPARFLRKPEPLYRLLMTSLGEDNDEVRLFWAVFACVAHNIVAGAIHRNPCGIILDGAGAQGVGAAVAANLGCPEAFLPEHRAGYFGSPEPTHPWPALVLTPGPLDQHAVSIWLQSAAARQAILAVPSAAARVLGLRDTWNIIRYPRQLGTMQIINPVAGQLLPAYLQNLCSRKLCFDQPRSAGALNILADALGWFAESGGDPTVGATAQSLLEAAGDVPPWRHFLELLLNLRTSGRLDFRRHGFEKPANKRTPAILYLSDPSRLWIPQDAVCEQIRQLAAMPPDLLKITESLNASGALKGEEVIGGCLGWVLDEEWYTVHEKQMETLL